jgi:hypothetical protein
VIESMIESIIESEIIETIIRESEIIESEIIESEIIEVHSIIFLRGFKASLSNLFKLL